LDSVNETVSRLIQKAGDAAEKVNDYTQGTLEDIFFSFVFWELFNFKYEKGVAFVPVLKLLSN
jgi:hypothetical protein